MLFKIYRPTEQFPEGGKMTTYLETLKEGDTINVEGPFGRFGYKPGNVVTIGIICFESRWVRNENEKDIFCRWR